MTKHRYWDSNVFLGLFMSEQDKVDKCRGVIKMAEEGELTIITSAITLVEVIKLKGSPKLDRNHESRIRGFFEQEYIAVRIVDRRIAERARDLIWQHNLSPKDAIHVATAIHDKIPVMDTFDDKLIKLSNKYGNPLLKIGKPDLSIQESLSLDDDIEL